MAHVKALQTPILLDVFAFPITIAQRATNTPRSARQVPRIEFSDAGLRSLKPPLIGTVDYWDSKLASFGCRVSQGGAKTFILKVHNSRRAIGRYPILSLAEARSEARRQLAEKTLGKVRPQSITFEEAKKLFIAEKIKSRRAGTVANHEDRLKRHFNFKCQVRDCSHQEIARRLRKTKTNAEHDHALSVAKTFFTWCHNHRYIDDNPTRGLSPLGSKKRARVLTDDELKLIWNACEQNGGALTPPKKPDTEGSSDLPRLPANFATIVKLLILTGQRRGEIAALRSNFYSHNAQTLCLPETLTKNKREHTFPIGVFCAEILSQATTSKQLTNGFTSSETIVSGGLYFPVAGTTSTFSAWSKNKKLLDQLSGVKDWTLHDLRRTFRTNLGHLGVLPHIAERLLNHVSAKGDMEETYDLGLYLPQMREAMLLWEERLLSIVG